MALPNINPTKTTSWQKLTNHFNDIQNITIKELSKDENRVEDFSLKFEKE